MTIFVTRGRAASTMCILMLCALSGSVHAAPRPSEGREVSAPYRSPVVGGRLGAADYGAGGYYWNCDDGTGCAVITRHRNERFLMLRIEDATGLPVAGRVYSGAEEPVEICGESPEPIDVRFSGEILVHLVGGNCLDGTPSTPTTGTVEARLFSRRPSS
jgi:hypothetical protein